MNPNESGILKGLSPEEILARKEMEGGIVYDDPFIPSPISSPTPEDLEARQNPLYTPPIFEDPASPIFEEPGVEPIVPPVQQSPDLGRVEPKRIPQPEFSPGLDFGWKNLPLAVLPSRGFFYPEGTKIAIRSAEVKEIRHFSTIDEDDLIDLDEKLNFILSKCSTMHFPSEGVVSYKDLKHEDRFFLIMAIRDLTFIQGENRIIITSNKHEEYENFDWEAYIRNYEDLSNITSKEEAWKHWITHGKPENRICEDLVLLNDYKSFQWKIYVNKYDDLCYIKSKEEAWKHFILYGFNEGRKLTDLKKIEEDKYKKIIELEEDISKNCDFSENKLYFKKQYTNCGKHFFGWKAVINHLTEHICIKDKLLNNKYYIDEWIEKLLVWGNKIQSKNCLTMIQDNQLQMISFLHGPPFENFLQKSNKDFILNDKTLLNKNIIELIHNKNLFNSISFLYVLSLHHKNYIASFYPEFKNKIVSLYHPINVYNYQKNELFDFNKFIKNRTIYHIGWWLRNFTTFLNFSIPDHFTKKILVKEEFKEQFEKQIININDKKIKIVNELNDDEYKKIFTNSCIFCDLADAVANNVVLECIKYNTPIIINRNPSVEEYLGANYPLFFENVDELIHFSDENYLCKKIIEAHKYLKSMDKTYLSLDTFVNKINYDLSKIKINEEKYKLTWLYYLNNEEDDIEQYISIFNLQNVNKNSKLIIINSLVSKVELLKNHNHDDIKILQVDENVDTKYVYDLFLKNSTTEYLTFIKIDDFIEENICELYINYFDNNRTYDIIIFKNNVNNSEFIDTNHIIDETNDEFELHNVYEISSESSESSENLSDCSINKSDFEKDNNSLEFNNNDDDDNENDDNDDENSIRKNDDEFEENDDDDDDNSSITESVSNKESKLYHYSEELLTYLQIKNYDFTNKNILWRKSIHSIVQPFNEHFWLQCYKNHFNIVEINKNF